MADERLRERERRAKLGGIDDREAWIAELRRTRAPQAQEAEAFLERLESAFAAIRQALDERWRDDESGTPPATLCPELPLEPVMSALETALSVREGMPEVGYGTAVLAHYTPRDEEHYRHWAQAGVAVVAGRLGDRVHLAIDSSSGSKPSPGTCGLINFRESLKPATKEAKLRAWAKADEGHAVWETWSSEEARLLVDLYRLQRAGAIRAPKPIAKKEKVSWRGVIRGIQPRLKLNRPYEEDEFFGAGYALRFEGSVDEVAQSFAIGVGPSAMTKQGFRVGDAVSGMAKPVEDPAVVPIDFYRVSKVKVESRGAGEAGDEPPWHGPGPDLETYRGMTPRPLADEAFEQDPCRACHWCSRVQVLDLPDYDEPLFTTCFGPTSCSAYVPPGGSAPAAPKKKKTPKKKTAKKKTAKKKTAKKKTAKKKPAKKKPAKKKPAKKKPAKKKTSKKKTSKKRLSSRFRRSLSAELAPLTPGAWSANRDDTWPACGRSRSEHGGPRPAVRQVACTQVRPRSSQLLSKRPYRGAHG